MQRNVLEYLEQAAGKNPDKIIFGDVKEELSSREFMNLAKRAGTALAGKLRQNHPASDRLFRSCLQREFLCAD